MSGISAQCTPVRPQSSKRPTSGAWGTHSWNGQLHSLSSPYVHVPFLIYFVWISKSFNFMVHPMPCLKVVSEILPAGPAEYRGSTAQQLRISCSELVEKAPDVFLSRGNNKSAVSMGIRWNQRSSVHWICDVIMGVWHPRATHVPTCLHFTHSRQSQDS